MRDRDRRRAEREAAWEIEFEGLKRKQAEAERDFLRRHGNLISALNLLGIDETELRAYVAEVMQRAI